MRAVGLPIVVLSLVVCTTARRLWTVTHGTRGCSVTCDIFNGKCPFPSKCTDIYWLRRVQVKCFKRGKQLYHSSGEVWCDRETDPNWSRGIGRSYSRNRPLVERSFMRTRMDKAYEEHVSGHCVKWDRYYRCLVKITENGEYVPTHVGEVMERRRLRARANFEEAVERRRLPSCYPSSFYVCPRYDSEKECKCKCKKQYQRCYSSATGRDCTTAGSPKRVCNGQRCIWDWGGWTPRGGNNLMDRIENCGNKQLKCEKRCPRSSSKKKHGPRWGLGTGLLRI